VGQYDQRFITISLFCSWRVYDHHVFCTMEKRKGVIQSWSVDVALPILHHALLLKKIVQY
jgi:hypothetical protein